MTFGGEERTYVIGPCGGLGEIDGLHGSGFFLGAGAAFGLDIIRTFDLCFLFGLLQNGFMARTPFKQGGAPAINKPAPQA